MKSIATSGLWRHNALLGCGQCVQVSDFGDLSGPHLLLEPIVNLLLCNRLNAGASSHGPARKSGVIRAVVRRLEIGQNQPDQLD